MPTTAQQQNSQMNIPKSQEIQNVQNVQNPNPSYPPPAQQNQPPQQHMDMVGNPMGMNQNFQNPNPPPQPQQTNWRVGPEGYSQKINSLINGTGSPTPYELFGGVHDLNMVIDGEMSKKFVDMLTKKYTNAIVDINLDFTGWTLGQALEVVIKYERISQVYQNPQTGEIDLTVGWTPPDKYIHEDYL
jgi:hypothetical protein